MITLAAIALVVCAFGFAAGSSKMFYGSAAVIAAMLCARFLP